MDDASKPLSRQGRKKSRLKTAKGRTNSSARWLARAINDPYISRAREEGFRARSAYKLLEIDDRFGVLSSRPWPRKIVDLGAAPGGWCQAATARLEEKGRAAQIVAVDLLEIDPLQDVTSLVLDMSDDNAIETIQDALGGRAGLVLSDMAAATTGHRQSDHLRTLVLAEMALNVARQVLFAGGSFVCKLFQGGETKDWLTDLRSSFKMVDIFKPPASRSDSVEIYIVARGYVPPPSPKSFSTQSGEDTI